MNDQDLMAPPGKEDLDAGYCWCLHESEVRKPLITVHDRKPYGLLAFRW